MARLSGIIQSRQSKRQKELRRKSEEMRRLHEGFGDLRKTFSKKECLHPQAPLNCRGRIIRAHTVQKSGGLTKIAENGHVLTPDSSSDPTEMKKIGINKASTFSGFCKLHDDQLFAPIEKRPFQLNRRHAFLLTFRGVSKELYLKRRTTEHEITDDLPFPEFWLNYRARANVAIQDLQPLYHLMGNALKRGNFRDTNYYAIELDSVPDILCNGTPNIEFDFHANRLQYLTRSERLEYITFSLLPYRNRHGVAVFSWFGKSSVNKKFIRSLFSLSKRDVPDAIARFAFQHIENMFLAPSWWNQLPAATKDLLIRRYDSTFLSNGFQFIDLRPDSIKLVDWNVVGKPKTNLKL